MKRFLPSRPEWWPEGSLGWILPGVMALGLMGMLYSLRDHLAAPPDSGSGLELTWEKPDLPPIDPKDIQELKMISLSFRKIAEVVGAAVANITVKVAPSEGPGGQRPDDGGLEGSPFEDFFEQFGLPTPKHRPSQKEQIGMGSGFIIDPKGILITNFHVVDHAREISVRLANSPTLLRAKVVGTDPRSDLALIQLNKAGEYPSVRWADSEGVEVGDWSIAIGSPFALGQTVTVGIVSAKGRNGLGLGAEYAQDLIQTDTAINPGNSGGPLCDLHGNIMGVNTAIYTQNGGYMGVGFAIPSNLAREISLKLVKDGQVTRGWLGVTLQPLDPELAAELGVRRGVGVHEVAPKSPAEGSGITAGDVILEVDHTPVTDGLQLQRVVSHFRPGQKVQFTILSYATKRKRSLTIKIGRLDEKESEDKSPTEPQSEEKLGLELETRAEGVFVEAIEPLSPAEGLLEPGDQIVTVNRKALTTSEDFSKLAGNQKKVFLELKRKGRKLFVGIPNVVAEQKEGPP